jgi:CHAT domain-containing protein
MNRPHFSRRNVPILVLGTACLLRPPQLRGADAADDARKLNASVDRLIAADKLYEAERQIQRLFEVLQSLRLPPNSPEMCRQRAKLAGSIYAGQGRLKDARRMLLADVERLKKYDAANDPDMDPIDYPHALYLLAKVEMDIAPNSAALRRFDEVIASLTARHMESDIVAARARKHKGLILGNFGDYVGSRQELYAAAAIFTKLVPQQHSLHAAVEQSLAASWMAEADDFRHDGMADEAGERLVKATPHQESAENHCKSIAAPTALEQDLIRLVKQSRTVLDTLQSALAQKRDAPAFPTPAQLFYITPKSRAEAEALQLNSEAHTHVAAGDYRQADAAWTKAKQLLDAGKNRNVRLSVITSVNHANLRTRFLDQAGEAAEQAAAALAEFRQDLLADLRFQTLLEKELQLTRAQPLLNAYLSAALKANRPAAEVYERVFQWKGILFEHALRTRTESQAAQRHRDLLEDVKQAREAHTRSLEAADAIPADRKERLADLETKEQTLATFLRQQAQLPADGSTARDFAERLDADTTYVEFEPFLLSSGNEAPRPSRRSDLRYLAFVLRKGHPIEMLVLPTPVEVVNDCIVQWRQKLPTGAAPGDENNRSAELAAQIAGMVWQPIAEHCQGSRLLWLCPSGVLWAMPFAALPDSTGDHLVRKHAIGYAISGRQALQSLESAKDRKGLSGRGLAIGDIEYADRESRVPRGGVVADDFHGRFRDGDAIKLVRNTATKPALLKGLREFGENVCFVGHFPLTDRLNDLLVYLYSPTELRRRISQRLPLSPFLVPLANADMTNGPPPTADNSPPNWTSREEMADAAPPLANRFEIWSCSGLLGPPTLTDGPQSFPQALLHAGYRIVLAGQWNVGRHAALAMMPDRFHTGLGSGLGDAEALRAAQCDAIDAGGPNADPYHWAAWVVVGDPGPAGAVVRDPGPADAAASTPHPSPTFNNYYFLLALIVVGIIAWTAFRWLRSSKHPR